MPSLPKTYKALYVDKPDAPWVLRDVELKHPEQGQVLVKVLACGVCYSDLEVMKGNMGDVFPRVPGHEIVGDVVELGSGVTRFSVGDRVGGPWHGGHDGECRTCQRNLYQMCDNKAINGVTKDGGYAEYVLLRAEAVVRVPKELDPAETAPLLCAGITVFNSIKKMEIEHGGIVAIQGLGGLGHLAVQYAKKMGYEVVALSTGDDKEKFARELGATHYINTKAKDAAEELMKLGGANLIVQTAPNPKLLDGLVSGLAPAGKLICLAPVGPAEVNTVSLVLKGASVHGWPSGHARDSEDAIRFAQMNGIKCMIERYPLSDIKKALETMSAGTPRFRNVLVME